MRIDTFPRRALVLLALGVLGLGLLAVPLARAFSDGQPASLVLGQTSFTTDGRATAQVLSLPHQIAIDPASGAVFVADTDNHRVLRFSSQAALGNFAADAVFGQTNFTNHGQGKTATSMFAPKGLAVDTAGRLWVADWVNNRVLRFDNAASKPTGAAADGVLGQPNFTSDAYGRSAHELFGPAALAVDSSGRLWVADSVNNRVLRFDNAASKPNGAPADGVLGQPDFTSLSQMTDTSRVSGPTGLALDGDGRLWVAATGNHRVLRFDNAASKPDGASADDVLGQPDFAGFRFGDSTSRMQEPAGLAVDASGRLWVADTLNSRVLRFDNAASKPAGAAADGVLGQAAPVIGGGLRSADRIRYPFGVAVGSGGRLWIADTYNERVLRFEDAAAKPDNAPADGLLGSGSFTTRGYVAADVLAGPAGVAVDPATGKVFVADSNNHRVLRFASRASLRNGAAAEGVLGQSGFTSNTPGRSAQGMYGPASVAVDASGRLWVADEGNDRVLRFDDAVAKPNGATADGVLGQPDFVSFQGATGAESMNVPRAVAVDASGRLWVADTYNHRVLRFDSAASKPNGAPADGVIGQPDFLRNQPGTSEFVLSYPQGLAVDASGRLWVADSANSRVLRFDNAAALSDLPPANAVLGQFTFTGKEDGTGPLGMRSPQGLAVDGDGRLWVADGGNHRVLRFDNAATLPNGASADGVLGQPDFTVTMPSTTAAGFWLPYGITLDSGSVWVADLANNRVLLFEDGGPELRVYLPLVRRTE